MDILKRDFKFNCYADVDGVIISFLQNERQTKMRGLNVQCPKAAREFAMKLLLYADLVEGRTTTIRIKRIKK